MNIADRETPVTAAHTLVDEHGRHVVFANVAECIEREHAALREALSDVMRRIGNDPIRHAVMSGEQSLSDYVAAILTATEPKNPA